MSSSDNDYSGIGGDYPMSASVVSDRAALPRRGLMLGFIFSMQGWGTFVGAITAIVLLEIFKKGIHDDHNYGQFDAVWRLLTGLIIIPCLGTLYQRLTLPESAKMKGVQALRDDPSLLAKGTVSGLTHNPGEKFDENELVKLPTNEYQDGVGAALRGGVAAKTAHGKAQAWRDFRDYFAEWRHMKTLIGTAACWFLLDITFYGISLNQSIVFSSLGLASSKGSYFLSPSLTFLTRYCQTPGPSVTNRPRLPSSSPLLAVGFGDSDFSSRKLMSLSLQTSPATTSP